MDILPLFGAALALLGIFLPWTSHYSVIGSQLDLLENGVYVLVFPFWTVFLCILVTPVGLLKRKVTRLVSLWCGILGIASLISISIGFIAYELEARIGFVFCWLGCLIMLIGAIVAWKHQQKLVAVSKGAWKVFLPLAGSFIVLQGMLLPWTHGYSGFSAAPIYFELWLAGSHPENYLFVFPFWIGFVCCLLIPFGLFRKRITRAILLVAGLIGLLTSIPLIIVVWGLELPGIIVYSLGFLVVLVGTIVAWKELVYTPAAPPPQFYPPA
jgi:hypothetical protein